MESANAADRQSLYHRTRINADLYVTDASQLDFIYQLFTPEMFATIAE